MVIFQSKVINDSIVLFSHYLNIAVVHHLSCLNCISVYSLEVFFLFFFFSGNLLNCFFLKQKLEIHD